MLQTVLPVTTYDEWRNAAVALLRSATPPERVIWSAGASDLDWGGAVGTTDGSSSDAPFTDPSAPSPVLLPARFITVARCVAYHRSPEKWSLLYRVLWRIVHEQRELMDVAVDDDVHALLMMEKAFRRDVHKMHAFVRFRRMEDGGGERYVAWHRPDHSILRAAVPFFVSRFGVMRWTILTPDASADWDGSAVRYGPGVPRSAAPGGDELEDLWRTYYAAIFNPARVKLRAMRREMPVRHWATLPETRDMDELLRDVPRRMEDMMKKAACPTTTSAADFLPDRFELPVLSRAAAGCRGCQIYCNATQTVFGEGPADAACMFVGEQPGDQEDLAGKPFIGPSGTLLSEVMEQVGIPRDKVYVTNAVKHFKFEPRGHRRIHSKPSAREVAACRPWLEAEIKTIKPRMIVCLGATAAQSLLGPAFRVTQHRGEVLTDTSWSPWLLATVHPSSLLRMPDAQAREEARAQFKSDLAIVSRKLKSHHAV